MTHFIVNRNGVYENYADELFKGTIRVSFPIPYDRDRGDTVEVTGEEAKESIQIAFNPMPAKLFQQALAFQEWCYEEKKSEGMVAFRYREGKWGLSVPEQWNGMASVCYHPEFHPEEMTGVVGDMHSHPKFSSSSHSQTDNLDERKMPGIFIVVKDFSILNCEPNIVGMVRGTEFKVRPELFIEFSEGIERKPSFPEEWKSRVHSSPCDECRKKRESQDAQKKISESLSQDETDKTYRLVPKRLLEAWKKFSCDGNTRGKEFHEAFVEWNRKSPSTSRLLFCSHWNCKKYISAPRCPDCNTTLSTFEIVQNISDAIDEVDAMEMAHGDLEILEEMVESEADGKEGGKGDRKEDPKEDGKRDVFVVVGEDEICGPGCNYRRVSVAHRHVKRGVLSDLCKDVRCAEFGHIFFSCAEMKARREKEDAHVVTLSTAECGLTCSLSGKPHRHDPALRREFDGDPFAEVF